MANFKQFRTLLFISVCCFLCLGSLSSRANDNRKVYIVYMGSKNEQYSLSSVDHLRILKQVLKNSTPQESLVRSYGRSFNGFAARLTKEESEDLKSMAGVVSVFPSRNLKLHTTRSWDFLGMPQHAYVPAPIKASVGNDVIIGVIDTGIWPESPSFNDDGFAPPPKKWKGVCNGGLNFTCNNKIIGARIYTAVKSARDNLGHGSHTASIAAGKRVDNTSFYGIAGGSVRGGAPFARIAVYTLCIADICPDLDLLAAFDDAISDGVDLITISAGSDLPDPFYDDVIAIGALHAMQKEILTVQSAGNTGRDSLGSVAPWILSVAASTTNRKIIDKFILGNGKIMFGNSVNSFELKGDKFPLVKWSNERYTSSNLANVTENAFEGKIIVSNDEWEIGQVSDGAVGVVSPASAYLHNVSDVVPRPATLLEDEDYQATLSYLKSTKPEATLLKSETKNQDDAPIVAEFSSRGPNKIAPDILKPDIAAPGVEILAAFSPVAPVSPFSCPSDTRSVLYGVLSGTSMSCPHAAGAAAYVKALHPDWSPSAIQSALMTTAHPMSPSNNPDREFAYGAGNLNPAAAANPGLVYEATQDDYITLMCKLNYTKKQIQLITGNKSVSCPIISTGSMSPTDVNYPTMTVKVDVAKPFQVEFTRTVTNVGAAKSTYTAKVESGANFKVTVEPNSISFQYLMEHKSFKVIVAGEGLTSKILDSGSLVWSDEVHSVRSPIVVYT